jgi:hypothetical protein
MTLFTNKYDHEEFEGAGFYDGCLYDIELYNIDFDYIPGDQGSYWEPSYPDDYELVESEATIRKYLGDDDKFLLAPNSPEHDEILRQFIYKHSKDVEDFIRAFYED